MNRRSSTTRKLAPCSLGVVDSASPVRTDSDVGVDVGRRRLAGAVTTGLALASGSLLALGAAAPARAAAAVGEPVRWPETITLLDGSTLATERLRHQAVLVVFFSTTCPFCTRHNPHVQKLLAASAGLPLRVIGAAQDKSADAVRAYVQRHGYSFDVTLDARALHEALSPRKVIPLTCVVDRSGRLREVIPGEMFEDDVLELAKWARA
jgi:peroxiredoxin